MAATWIHPGIVSCSLVWLGGLFLQIHSGNVRVPTRLLLFALGNHSLQWLDIWGSWVSHGGLTSSLRARHLEEQSRHIPRYSPYSCNCVTSSKGFRAPHHEPICCTTFLPIGSWATRDTLFRHPLLRSLWTVQAYSSGRSQWRILQWRSWVGYHWCWCNAILASLVSMMLVKIDIRQDLA